MDWVVGPHCRQPVPILNSHSTCRNCFINHLTTKKPHLHPPRSPQHKTKHKNDLNVRHALCSSGYPGTGEHVAGPGSANTSKERQGGNTDVKNNGQIKSIDGSGKNGLLSKRWTRLGHNLRYTHCLAPLDSCTASFPRVDPSISYQHSRRPICTVWRVILWERLFFTVCLVSRKWAPKTMSSVWKEFCIFDLWFGKFLLTLVRSWNPQLILAICKLKS